MKNKQLEHLKPRGALVVKNKLSTQLQNNKRLVTPSFKRSLVEQGYRVQKILF